MLDTCIYIIQLRHRRFAPFGSTDGRFKLNQQILNEQQILPAPNAYNVIKKDSFITKTFNCTYY